MSLTLDLVTHAQTTRSLPVAPLVSLHQELILGLLHAHTHHWLTACTHTPHMYTYTLEQSKNHISLIKTGLDVTQSHPLCRTHAHIYMHTYTCTHIHAHIYMHTYTCTHTCTHTHAHIHAHIHMHTHMHTHIHMHTHTHAHMHTCTHTCTHTGIVPTMINSLYFMS